MIVHSGPEKQFQLKKQVKKTQSNYKIAFYICLFLPVLAWFTFAFKLLPSASKYSKEIQMPVALLQTSKGSGTAFLVGETKLITACHVVLGLNINDKVTLIFDKSEPIIQTTAKLICKSNFKDESSIMDVEEDFAILELSDPSAIPNEFPRFIIGNSDDVTTLDDVISIGYPNQQFMAVEGKISNTKFSQADLFQLDVSSYPGNSGGPIILKSSNEVIGVLHGGLTDEFKGINCAAKINRIFPLLKAKGIDLNK